MIGQQLTQRTQLDFVFEVGANQFRAAFGQIGEQTFGQIVEQCDLHRPTDIQWLLQPVGIGRSLLIDCANRSVNSATAQVWSAIDSG